ncbi:carbohydrate esterase family 3 protein [Annulohypoxylon truncatum]|uniref:carbohydrate esterase family 3 protein n=1 Tax=Annulohypoxylon truncatum TaxID=327061 RepID=UPI00200763DE|nr:carbohydrate esterase family 3 protein [Annulohypoxylon truncatum]KAI1210008.1 carbohydrate esterase family 3 protein [Annulohypoxylon truncatum]
MKTRRFLAEACLIGTAFAQAKLKIMPLGDSLTELTCWRAKLWSGLKADNLTDRIEFVGSMNNTLECDTADEEFAKQHHEGHSGYLAIDIAYDHIEGWINDTKPDIVTFMLGTDDIVRGRRLEDVVEAYTNMVETMRKYNEYMKIIVNTVVPLPANREPVNNLNGMIPGWAQEQNKTESPIYVNDIYPFPDTFLKDGIYPNDEGEEQIVGTLYPLLTWIINSNTTNNDTTPS